MIEDELTNLAGLLSSRPISPDSYKLSELLGGLDAERSRLGRRKFAVVLNQQAFDFDGLTDYVYLLDSFDDPTEAIASVESNARNLLAMQTAQPDSYGNRWLLESKGNVRMLPNSRAGLWTTESKKDKRSNPEAKRKLHVLHDQTYKILASEYDSKYNCFRAIGPFADFVVSDELFEIINSQFELWSYFVEVGETVRAGKPRPAPQ